MDIIVCVKNVPDVEEADLRVAENGKDIKKEDLVFNINDWDNYAVEEAVLLKEKHGGTVTAVTVGGEDDEEVLRRALAMGADKALRVEADTEGLDSLCISQILCRVAKDIPFDLIFTGVLAEDDYSGTTGMMMAEELGINHANMAIGIEIEDQRARVTSELEEGLSEICLVDLPALLAIQSGINEPRYVSIMGIRKASKKELKTLSLSDLGLEELSPKVMVKEAFLPPETEGAEIISGDPDKIASNVVDILKRKGAIQ